MPEGFILYRWKFRPLEQAVYRLMDKIPPWFGDLAALIVFGPLALRYVRNRKVVVPFLIIFLLLEFPKSLTFLLGGMCGYILFLLGLSARDILLSYALGYRPPPGVGLLIPGMSVGGMHIPLIEGIIGLFVALFVHEVAHGVVAVREGVRVKDAGILTLLFLPIGAYVEPDERVFARASKEQKLRILSAGPAANFIIATIILVTLPLLAPFGELAAAQECQQGIGVKVLSVPQVLEIGEKVIPSAAYGKLKPGDIIFQVNGEDVHCAAEFLNTMERLREENVERIVLGVQRDGNILYISIEPVNGYIGIRGVETAGAGFNHLGFLLSLLTWIYLINGMLGLANALPLPPLDGGLAINETWPRVGKVLTAITLLLLAVNLLPWFF